MTIRLYNTLTRSKDPFVPQDPHHVRMYVCGPTVYDFAHIGNARPVIVFDVLFRLLRHVYGADHVSYVRNITDIDDKIIARAAAEGRSIGELTLTTARQFHEDIAALGVLPPTHEPRATEYVPQMVGMIEALIAKGHAYEAEGHVLFSVSSYAAYGQLSGRSTDEMLAGARVEVAPYKRDPMDFVLWKPSTEDQPGWDSPWGRGRPGWHIECSAMGATLLGETFDIHGGGIDLAFPHHENEIAQSACAHHGEPHARVWMHNGFLQVEGQKMSKSLGNFLTIHGLLEAWRGENLRLLMLMTQYRQPIDWTEAGLKEARVILKGWYEAGEAGEGAPGGDPDPAIVAALADDLNTPAAIAELHRLAGEARASREAAARLRASAQLLGLLQEPNAAFRAFARIDEARVAALIEARLAARKAKDFAEADRIRDALDAMGVQLKDGPSGTTWEPKA